jgi:hypothetical protein
MPLVGTFFAPLTERSDTCSMAARRRLGGRSNRQICWFPPLPLIEVRQLGRDHRALAHYLPRI